MRKLTRKRNDAPPKTTSLTPREIVAELDKYIVGQHDAKRAVAIAIRNRWRRQQLPAELAADAAAGHERVRPLPKIKGAIELAGVHFQYPGQSAEAVAGIDLSIAAGRQWRSSGRPGPESRRW